MSQTVRKATHSDIDAIFILSKKYELADGGKIPESGFLVSGFDAATYTRFVDEADHFYICLEGETTVGFILAYSPKAITPKNRVESLVHCAYPNDFVTVKQVVVDMEHRRKGIATRLYKYLKDQTVDAALVAAIVLVPPNPTSVAVHERLGFQRILEIEGEDGLPRGVWHCPAKSTTQQCHLLVKIPNQNQLIARMQYQHEIAALLYCHEDNLNWVKVGSLLTLLVLLGGVYSFYWNMTSQAGHAFSTGQSFPVYIVLVLGVLIHTIFIVSLNSGIQYMMARKDAVIDLENRLRQLDANLVPLVVATSGISTTARVLRWFPSISLVVWIVAAILLIIRVHV